MSDRADLGGEIQGAWDFDMHLGASLSLSRCLGPGEISAVDRAFRDALRAVSEGTIRALSPLELRRTLARGVIEPALMGERDPTKLCQAALRDLGLLYGAQP